MTLHHNISTVFFKKHLKKVFFLIVLLVTMVSPDANAFPDFCSDITSAPDRVLTGCQFNATPLALQDVPLLEVTAVGDASPPIDAMLSMAPKNRELFRIGRETISDDQDEKKENAYSPGVTEKQTVSDTASEILLRDEHWFYMNIDKEGTYLFFGDVGDMDEPMTNMDKDDLLPDGIGIGKRWQF
jgi:hypothetical protein